MGQPTSQETNAVLTQRIFCPGGKNEVTLHAQQHETVQMNMHWAMELKAAMLQ